MFGGEGANSLFEGLNGKQFALKIVVLIHMSVKIYIITNIKLKKQL